MRDLSDINGWVVTKSEATGISVSEAPGLQVYFSDHENPDFKMSSNADAGDFSIVTDGRHWTDKAVDLIQDQRYKLRKLSEFDAKDLALTDAEFNAMRFTHNFPDFEAGTVGDFLIAEVGVGLVKKFPSIYELQSTWIYAIENAAGDGIDFEATFLWKVVVDNNTWQIGSLAKTTWKWPPKD